MGFNRDIDLYSYLPDSLVVKLVFNASHRIALYRMLSSLITGRVPIDVCLRHLYERKREQNRPDAFIIKKWLSRLERGDQFHSAIRDEVPAQERVLIASGASTNKLAEGLNQAIRATSGAIEITRILRGGLMQPALLLATVAVMLIGFSLEIAPAFQKMLPEDQWGGYSGALLKTAKYVTVLWPFALVAIAAIVGGFIWSLPNWTGPWRDKLDKRLPYSVYRSYNGSVFMIALSALLEAGTSVDMALKQIRSNSPPWLADHISRMIRSMDEGLSSGEALDTGLIDGETSDQLYIYSKTADFDSALQSIGEEALEQGKRDITAKTATAKLFALICIGAMVGWIQLSIYDVQNRMSAQQSAMVNR